MTHTSSTSVTVRAPLARVWEALTTPALVKKYFWDTNLVTDWAVGSPLFFRGEWEGKPYEDRGTVLAFEPPRTLSYNYWSAFSGTPDTEATRTIVRYVLDETPDGTRLTVAQSNFDTQARADESAKNWSSVLEGLRKMLETR